MYETGHFASLWQEMAQLLGLEPEFIPGDWRSGTMPQPLNLD
jgi:alanine-glyoxylate transaminase/serine-glyoxylate transaminase/serine-pyruvate transaminase